MRHNIKKLPDLELEVMQALWTFEPPVPRALVEEKIRETSPLAQTTILTLLSRLVKKGFVKAEKQGRSSAYTPLVSREEYLASQSRRFFDKLCKGSVSDFATALADSGISREDLAELRRLLEEGEL